MAAERLQVILELVTGQYKKEAREAATSTRAIGAEAKKTGSGFSGMAGGMKLVAAAAAGFVATRLVGFLGDAAKAAAEDQKAQELLRLAIQNSSDATADDIAKNEEWINTTSRMTGVADDELRPALGNLVRATGDLETAQDQLGVAMDIAAARGLDLNTVTMAMSKAANGNVGVLGRLGIKVKDAEGNMLSYEEVLQSATDLMGGASATAAGSLAGQLERQKIAWEETKETIGGAVLPVFGELLDLVMVAGSVFDTETNASIARMNQVFNDLVRSGIDPAANKLQTFITILAGTADTSSVTVESLEALTEMVGVTSDDFLTAAKYVEDHATELELNAEEAEALIDVLEDQVVAEDKAALGVGRHKKAVEDDTTAIQENIDKIRELTDPLFALIKADERAKEAQANYNEQVRLHGDYSEEAYDASIDLATAQLELNGATATYAAEGGPASVQALRDTLDQAGLSATAIQRVIDKVTLLNATPVTNPLVRSDARVGRRASGGPVYAGHMYQAGEGNRPELLVIPGDNGRVFSNSDSRALIAAMSGGGSNTQIAVHGYTRNLDESIRLAGMYAGISRRIEARRR